MLNDFFKLNQGYVEICSPEELRAHLNTSRHLLNIAYMPDTLVREKLENVIFEEVSFSKTTLKNVTIKNCKFINCLFIGTVFERCSIHNSNFNNCNFFKCKFRETYAKPFQFKSAITNKDFSNIAVSLFNELRNQYKEDSQREFKSEAEYYFHKWKRVEDLNSSRKENQAWYKYTPRRVSSFLHYILFGFGYRLRNLIATTLSALGLMVFINHHYAAMIFTEISPSDESIIKSIYFTITTMATLGASGVSNFTEFGYIIVVINVLVGISLLTFTANSILNRVVR
ncbi:pentapeptide repeat-containing protein [Aeromonas veronii]|uniref:pentapeptide repeat-containing protein n=1 Tax=Aeromonas veronii TaxID=654 RepID=UPI000E1E704D|nr:pentapeptide repeat-containing protein [Aeromonas veronii]RDU77751.1 hypothetical protein CHF44_21635 [Aeromonas veronii]RDU89274.1 hypothetical protein CHH34_19825 [Aeromonas veronii]TEY58868.1 hypothetical protein CIG15_20495 [Aeromonas veronii]